ncbi:prophage antirepressor [Xylanimonas cellulosilytica DSM 15894]|uniref:Prophage antirepressor n=1 Tax=Xylanimonas cellulosilytica (strain DSM 15894 / JCM 12276 / CECT 5975 / KCTC 9989 / LMG 20990 / NBRC 107835 / XIL07) TaxID=446471 RepID=D1BW60_XYLCX|nr:phage antirepressor KilAC domain-containing protein [Xylanimonas cellulosilytica]ACZ29563.1 prophage antirepressor [Xylanimonas cellulosilytica DSM 15894]
MTTDLQQFDFHGAGVRIITDEHGDPWFVAADVAAALSLGNIHSSLSLLDDDEKGLHTVETLGGAQTTSTVNEPGLYSLVLRSRKPEAKAFKRWVTHDVLPAIRKTGSYGVPALTGPELMARALIEADATIKAAHAELAVARPKVEAFDAFLSTDGDYSVRDAAHVLSRHHAILTGEKRLRDWMLTAGWLYRDPTGAPRAYQRRIDAGHLVEKAQWHYRPDNGEKVTDPPQVRVTPRGIEALAKALTKVTAQGELTITAS